MFGNLKKDHLVGWEICCRPKKNGEGLGLGNVVPKNICFGG